MTLEIFCAIEQLNSLPAWQVFEEDGKGGIWARESMKSE